MNTYRIAMKKMMLSLPIALLCLTIAVAQPGPPPPPDAPLSPEALERVEAMKVAMITKQLNLSVEESQKFWPVYNQYREKEQELKRAYKPDRPLDSLSDKEAESQLQRHLERIDKEAALEIEYLQKVRQVLPARKVLKLHQVEAEFRKRLVNEVRNRQGQNRQQGKRRR